MVGTAQCKRLLPSEQAREFVSGSEQLVTSQHQRGRDGFQIGASEDAGRISLAVQKPERLQLVAQCH